MGEPWKRHTEWKEADAEGHVSSDSHLRVAAKPGGSTEEGQDGGWVEGGGCLLNGWVQGLIWISMVVMALWPCKYTTTTGSYILKG